jgi:hypothetical protein
MAGTANSPALGAYYTYTTSSSADEMDVITAPAEAVTYSIYFVTSAGKVQAAANGTNTITTATSFTTHYGPIPAGQWITEPTAGKETIGIGSGSTSVTYHVRFYGETQ